MKICRHLTKAVINAIGALAIMLLLSFPATAQDRAASGGSTSVGVGSRIDVTKDMVNRFVSAQQGVLSGVETTVETTNTNVITRIGQLRDTIIGTGSCRCDLPPVASCPAGQTADTNGTCCDPATQVGGICQVVPTGLTCNATQLEGCNLPSQAIQPNMSVLVNGVCAAGLVPVSGATSCNATCRADAVNAAYTSPNTGCVPSACPAGTEDVNGQCLPVCDVNQVRNAQGSCVCAPNFELVNGQCIAVCPTGQVRDAQGVCAPVPCPQGTEDVGGQCLPVCPANQVRNAQGSCVCATGFEMVGGQCVAVCPQGQVRNPQGVCAVVSDLVPGRLRSYNSNGEDPYGQCGMFSLPALGGDRVEWNFLNPARDGLCENGNCTGGLNSDPAPGPYPAGVQCWRKADGSNFEWQRAVTCSSASTTTWQQWGWTCEPL